MYKILENANRWWDAKDDRLWWHNIFESIESALTKHNNKLQEHHERLFATDRTIQNSKKKISDLAGRITELERYIEKYEFIFNNMNKNKVKVGRRTKQK